MAKKKKSKGVTRKELHDIFLSAKPFIHDDPDISQPVKNGLLVLMDILAACACDDPTDPGGPC